MFDLLIKNGKIMDGTGNPWFFGDVAIKDSKIEKVGFIDSSLAREVIDAKGLVVAPGFVDIHNHSDFVLPLDERPKILEPFVRQGVTTIVTGNCGFSPAPINPETLGLLKIYSSFLQAAELKWEWHDMKGYMDFIEKKGVLFDCHFTNRGRLSGIEPLSYHPLQATARTPYRRLHNRGIEEVFRSM